MRQGEGDGESEKSRGGEGKVSLGEGIHLELADLVHHLVDQREGERNVWGVRWGKGEGMSRRMRGRW